MIKIIKIYSKSNLFLKLNKIKNILFQDSFQINLHPKRMSISVKYFPKFKKKFENDT
jgi:hypothetical protein